MFKKPFINNRIRANEVRLIDEKGEQIGITPIQEALEMAREKNLDLIQVTEKVIPPICKILDYGKYVYRQEKKERKGKKQVGNELKGIRLKFNISKHDMETKANQAKKFLEKGNKIRIEMRLRGRERALQGFAEEKIKEFIQILEESIECKEETKLKKKPRGLTIIISKK